MFFIGGVFNIKDRKTNNQGSHRLALRLAKTMHYRNSQPYSVSGHRFSFVASHNPSENRTFKKQIQAACVASTCDFSELARRLALKNSDVPVNTLIQESYEKWGDDFLVHLSGGFSIALYDERRNRFLLARDKIGLQPLFYLIRGPELIFSSEARPLFQLRRKLQPNFQLLHSNIFFGSTFSREQALGEVQELPPGHALVIGPQGKAKVRPYWDIDFTQSRRDSAFYKRQFKILFDQSIRRCLPVDNAKVGLALSGGIDSSLVLAKLKEHFNGEIEAFTAYTQTKDDPRELNDARRAAKYFGVKHHAVLVSGNIIKQVPKVIWYLSDLVINKPFLGLLVYALGQAAKNEKCRYLFSGDGAELNLDGNSPLRDLWARYHEATHLPVKAANKFSKKIREEYFSGIVPLREFDDLAKMYIKFYSFWGTEERLKGFYTADFLKRIRAYRVKNIVSDYFKFCRKGEYFSKFYYMDLKTWNSRRNLVTSERLLSASGISYRLPFLDSDLVGFCATIPTDVKLNPDDDKYFLCQTYPDVLPKNIIQKGKVPSGLPLDLLDDQWDILSYFAERFRNRKIFKKGYIDKEMTAAIGMHGGSYRLMPFFVLELWFRIFVDRKEIREEDLTLERLS